MGRFWAVSSRFIVGLNSGQNRIQRSAGNIAKRFAGYFRETAMGPRGWSFIENLGGSRRGPQRVLGQIPRHFLLDLVLPSGNYAASYRMVVRVRRGETGLHSFSRGIPKDTLSLGKRPSAYPTYPRIVISAGWRQGGTPTPRTVSLGPRGGALFDVAMCKR